MATSYDGESAANKALLDDYNSNLRSCLGELARLVNRAEVIKAQYDEEITTLFNAWNANEELPNNSGLAGSSVSEDHEQIETWQSYLGTLITNLGSTSHEAQYVSAAGPDNVLSGE